jgi:hypothetical protein
MSFHPLPESGQNSGMRFAVPEPAMSVHQFLADARVVLLMRR